MLQNKETGSRRRFMVWSASIISGFSLILMGVRSRRKKDTVKMLTEDGRLVEVDKRLLTGAREKISIDDLKGFVKSKKI